MTSLLTTGYLSSYLQLTDRRKRFPQVAVPDIGIRKFSIITVILQQVLPAVLPLSR